MLAGFVGLLLGVPISSVASYFALRAIMRPKVRRAAPNNGMHPTRIGVGDIRQLGRLRSRLRAGDASTAPDEEGVGEEAGRQGRDRACAVRTSPARKESKPPRV